VFLITVWQLLRTFGGPITEAENPWHLLARSSIFAVLIGYAKPIFLLTLDIARAPYTALMDTAMTASDFTFAGVENVLKSGLVTLIGELSVVGLILMLILEISLGWNYFKVLLEVVERYVVVGVLCYTSPLAFAMGGSKTTNQVFKSWCRMVGSQLLLLCMNVWFLRGFNSSVGQFIGNGGALTNGQGNIFLWMFCALAFLKTAQKFDSYLAAMGLNVAQTGGSMGMEMLMAARVLGGFGGAGSPGGSPRSVGSIFRGGSGAAGSAATGAAATGGFMAGFTSRFKPNSYVRDAVVEGGAKMGAGGGIGFVGRTFGGMAARNGATLTGESVGSVASRPAQYSGKIGGDIADRSLPNYLSHLNGQTLSDTQISGGQISTTVATASGKEANVEMFNASQFEKPDMPHTTTETPITRSGYSTVNVELPIYSGGAVNGSKYETYHTLSGTETLTPEKKVVKYLACTISPLNRTSILSAFGLDPNAAYGDYSITNANAIDNMSYVLIQTLFGAGGIGNLDIHAVEGEITRIGKYPIPVTGPMTITSGFGQRIHPITGNQSFHYGLDLAGVHHAQIISIADGEVMFAGLANDGTNIVKIKHVDENGKVFYSRYLHLASIYVTAGQTISAEQVIGTEGGEPGELGAGSSTGPHLHFELRDERDVAYNPYDALFKKIS
jgi:murein DD-endopeptidase MepM/ murein hydrolase activator NlpD